MAWPWWPGAERRWLAGPRPCSASQSGGSGAESRPRRARTNAQGSRVLVASTFGAFRGRREAGQAVPTGRRADLMRRGVGRLRVWWGSNQSGPVIRRPRWTVVRGTEGVNVIGRRSRRRGLMAALAVLAVTALVAGCGGGGERGGASDESATSRGPFTYVQGKDNTNTIRPLLDKWNTAHPNEKITFKEQSDEADQQHDDLVQHFQAKDADYDVVSVDV